MRLCIFVGNRSGIPLFLLLFFFFLIFSAQGFSSSSPLPKKVLIVHSYEHGQVCGQPQADGVVSGLASAGFVIGKNLTVEQFFMDTKKIYTSKEEIEERGQQVLAHVKSMRPDVVVTLDDNAARTVMLALAGTSIPVVFSGINVQPEVYNQTTPFMDSRSHPGSNVTGVYEKLHVKKAMEVMRSIIGIRTVAVIVDSSPSGNAIKKQVELEMLESSSEVAIVYYQVTEFEEFKELILKLNEDPEIGAVYSTAVTLKTADRQTVTAHEIFTWLFSHSRKPDIALNYFFSQLGMFGGAAVDFKAMGEQAGIKVASILKGTPPGDIPIEDARKIALVFNLERARQLDISIPIDVLSAADILYDSVLLKPEKKVSKILIVQSYERGQGCGSSIESGLLQGLDLVGYRDGVNLDLYHYYMDTQYENTTEDAIARQGQLALHIIDHLQPDIVVVMDDNAFESVLLPLVDSKYPVLFGGTNVPLELYNEMHPFMANRSRPGRNVTGVTEEHETLQSLRLIKSLAPSVKTAVTIYSGLNPFMIRMAEANETYLTRHGAELPIRFIKPQWVESFSDYKKMIEKYNNDPSVDLIYSFAPLSLLKDDGTVASVQESVGWMADHQKKPGFTWMTNWVRFGYLASAGIDLVATGQQLADKVVKVINGVKPGELSIERPGKYSIALNLARAKYLGIEVPIDILEAAAEVYTTMPPCL